MKSKLLDYIEKTLTNAGIAYEKVSAETNQVDNTLVIQMGPDSQGRERMLVVFDQKMDLDNYSKKSSEPPIQPNSDLNMGANGSIKKKAMDDLLHVSCILPFQVEPGSEGETARLILYYNSALDFPGFGFDERNNVVYYRYPFMKPNGVISEQTILGLLGTAMLSIDSMSDSIESVAKGLKSMPEALLENIQKLTSEE